MGLLLEQKLMYKPIGMLQMLLQMLKIFGLVVQVIFLLLLIHMIELMVVIG